MSACLHSVESRRARAARRSIEVLEAARERIDNAIAALRVQVAEEGHALAAHDSACADIDKAQSLTYDCLANLRSSR